MRGRSFARRLWPALLALAAIATPVLAQDPAGTGGDKAPKPTDPTKTGESARPPSPKMAETLFKRKLRDGLEVEACLSLPAGQTAAQVRRAVLLVHGSGPLNMDSDFQPITRKKATNPFFRDLRDALIRRGFAVLRYHKRSYQIGRLEQPHARPSAAFLENPLGFFIEDAREMLKELGSRCPKAKRLIVGHSQGSTIALQIAHLDESLAGFGLIGYSSLSLETLLFEQFVIRPMFVFRRLDADHDGLLSEQELKGDERDKATLRGQRKILDVDRDGAISASEMKAGNLSNLVLRPEIGESMRRQEAALPKVGAILAAESRPIAIFQGLYDNQCFAYHAQAVQMCNAEVWKHPALKVTLFPGLGHALDRRDNLMDLRYRRAEPSAIAQVAAQLDELVPVNAPVGPPAPGKDSDSRDSRDQKDPK